MKKTITIQGINIKNGTSKAGKDWTRYGFFDGTDWFNMWKAQWNEDIQSAVEGDTIEVYLTTKEFKGKKQFEIVDPNSPELAAEKWVEDEIKKLKDSIEILDARMQDLEDVKEKEVQEDEK